MSAATEISTYRSTEPMVSLGEVHAFPEYEQLDRRLACFHEAGHIVASIAHEVPMDWASIWLEDGRWTGRVNRPFVVVTKERYFAHACASMAGPIAERACRRGRHIKRPHEWDLMEHGGEEDILIAERWSQALRVPRSFDRIIRQTATLIRENWSAVERWASLLDAKEDLNFDLISGPIDRVE